MGISYRKHGNENWEYRIIYKDPITQKPKEKSKRGFKSKPEARYAAQEMEKHLLNNFELATSNISLKEYLYNWLKEYKKDVVRKNTYELHRRNIDNHIIPYFQNINLKEIKPTLYQKFLNHLYGQGYSKRTIEIIHNTLYGAMEKALQLNMLEKNPCAGAIIKGKEKDRAIKFIDSDDIGKFLKEAYNYGYVYWIFFKVMIETGIRKGEAAALQWSDIDFKSKTISISKTLDFQAASKDSVFGDPKTYNSKRTITISQSLVNDLRFHMNWQNQNKTALNEIYRHDLYLVLCRENGDIMPKSSLFNAFERILKRADIPKLPIHSLRHTHAVLLMEAGADMKYIQERLGHGSYQITADVYSHVSKTIDKSNFSKYENYMNKVLE